MKFTKIPTNTFSEMQLNAGIFLSEFDPKEGTVDLTNIIAATSGGCKFTDSLSFIDMGEGVDNCPKNMMELKKLDTHEVKMAGTAITVDADALAMLAAAADTTTLTGATGVSVITPRQDVATTDYKTIWWVGDYSDKNGETNGGFIAIKLLNGLNTAGFSLQSSDKDKGTFAFEFVGHYSMEAQTKVPYELYIKAGTAESV